MTSAYKTLGVSPAADAKAIKAAFRRLAKQYHPDLHPGDRRAEQRFKDISSAYEVLGNPLARAQYDAMRAALAARARQSFRAAAATMAASFLVTASVGLFVGTWMLMEGII